MLGIRKCAYTELNPRRAGLTLPKEWPGLTSARYRAGDLEALRPEVYFSDRRPGSVPIQLTSSASALGLDLPDGIDEGRRRSGHPLSGAAPCNPLQ